MNVEHPRYLPTKYDEKEEMKTIQEEIGEEAIFQNKYESATVVAGIDQAFTKNDVVTAVIVMEDDGVVEDHVATTPITHPYIPGLLAFREAPSIVKALKELQTEPDLLMFDGSGRIHYRQAGIATHCGVLFDTASVGVEKNLLCGDVKETRMEEGERRPITADESVNTDKDTVIGHAYQSKQYRNRKVNPLYISPGHKIDVPTSTDIIERYCDTYKLPEPIRKADKKATEAKHEYQ